MKNWIKWFGKLLFFILLIILVDNILGGAFDSLRVLGLNKNPEAIALKTEYSVEKMDEDIVVIGSSLASRHYVPSVLKDSLGYSVFNAGQDGFFFYCQNALINLTLQRYSPKMIIWEIGETSLSRTNETTEFQAMNRLFPYYNMEYCKNMVDSMNEFQKYKMLSKMYRYNSSLSVLIRNIRTIEHNDNGYIGLPSEGYQFPSKFHVESVANLDSVRVFTFLKTLEECKSKNVKVVIASSPRYCDGSELNSNCYQTLRELCSNNNIPFLDYYYTFSSDSTMFKDASHMNEKGAMAYSKMIVGELRNSLIY